MKGFLRVLLIATAVVAIVSCTRTNYRIQGKTADDDSSKVMYLYLNRDTVAIDSAKVENHLFSFEGVTEGSKYACVNNGDEHSGWIFFLEQGDINLSDTLWYATGSPLNDAFVKFNNDADSLDEVTNDISLYKALITKVWAEHNNDALGAYITGRCIAATGNDFIDSLYKSAGPDIQNDVWFYTTAANIETAKKVAPGSMFTDMKVRLASNVENLTSSAVDDTVSLSDFLGKGKIVVMDCWASWCQPCRELIGEMKASYRNIQKKGAVVLGMATRDKYEDTKAAVKELELPWTVISDDGMEKSACDTYGFRGIPYVIIFNRDGKILARDYYSEKQIIDILNGALP